MSESLVSTLSEEENERKYGPKTDDNIARQYRDSHDGGNYFCKGCIEKYIKRFCSVGSVKSGNVGDLKKAQDYLTRMIQMNEGSIKPEVIER